MTLPKPFSPRRRAIGIGIAAWTALPSRAQTPAPRVVASFSILADMARELAPAGTEVTALVGADADAHVFEPSPADGKRLAQADLVLVNGLNFEGWMERLVKVSGYRGPVVVAALGVATRGVGGAVDPHVWQDLTLAKRCVQNIAAAFVARWPERRTEIEARQAAYTSRINELDRRTRERLATVPRAQRRVMTSHDAFGYFGAAYEVDFVAPQGWATSSEPSAATVARLIRQIREQRVRALFVENISDPRLMQRIAQEGNVTIGGTLYSDALSAAGGPADTYLKLFDHNASSLATALAMPR